MFAHAELDPRSKLAFTLAVVGLTIALPRFEALAAVAGAVVLLVSIGRGLSVGHWIEFVHALKVLVPAIFLLNLVFYSGGTVLWRAPLVPLAITVGGLETSSLIVVRLLIIAGVAAWFAMTTTAEAFEAALVSLGVPWSLAFVLSLSLRLIPEMRSRYQTVEDAQRSRGLAFEGGPLRRARARIPTFIPFFVAVIEFGYELADALVVRDFGYTDQRTSVVSVQHRRPDYGLYGVSAGLVVVVLVLFI